MKNISIRSLHDLHKAAKQFIDMAGSHRVFAFHGGMGAGKTTFIKAICGELGVADNITSPSFALVNEYLTETGESIYHFDCYRLKTIHEAYDIGAEEYFYSGNYCFIEWPERIEALLPNDAVMVEIWVADDESRELRMSI
jgi:tRNA threonylcarbamoyladenosine biosynthesis protein TsaE